MCNPPSISKWGVAYENPDEGEMPDFTGSGTPILSTYDQWHEVLYK